MFALALGVLVGAELVLMIFPVKQRKCEAENYNNSRTNQETPRRPKGSLNSRMELFHLELAGIPIPRVVEPLNLRILSQVNY